MTTYETVMVVLTALAFIVSIIGIIVKLLLIIIDKSAKKYKIQGQPLTGSSFFKLHYSLYKTESQYTSSSVNAYLQYIYCIATGIYDCL